MNPAGAGAATAAGGAAAVAMISEAIKASGVVVRVGREAFVDLLARQEAPIVLHATYGVFTTKHRYLTSYKGLGFILKTPEPLELPPYCELMEAKKISHPEL